MPRDVMTPAWSHALTTIAQSPYWGTGLQGMDRFQAYVEAVSGYATYDDLPDRLKAIFDQAKRMMGGGGNGRSNSRGKRR